MKPQLNSREAPTLTRVTGILVFFFSSIHLNSRKYRSFHHVHLNHGLSICESVQQKVTQVGSISPPQTGQMSFFIFTFKLL